MTVAELIERLKQLPPEALVYRDGGEYKDHHEQVHTAKLFRVWGLEGVVIK